jgi:hypothetical protein
LELQVRSTRASDRPGRSMSDLGNLAMGRSNELAWQQTSGYCITLRQKGDRRLTSLTSNSHHIHISMPQPFENPRSRPCCTFAAASAHMTPLYFAKEVPNRQENGTQVRSYLGPAQVLDERGQLSQLSPAKYGNAINTSRGGRR